MVREIEKKDPVPSDYEIAQSIDPLHISQIAKQLQLTEDQYDLYGKYKAKVDLLAVRDKFKESNVGNYVVVAGISPTPLGEGKSTTTLGLVQGLAHINKLAIACIRQPSQGPTFGIKGGAAGGGYSQVIPMEDMNLHLTGDIHAITAANNLLAAAIDTRCYHEKIQADEALFNRLCPKSKQGKRQVAPIMLTRLLKLGYIKDLNDGSFDIDTLSKEQKTKFARLNIDPNNICWNRVVDINDRYLRQIEIGLAPTEKGFSRKTSYDIAVASEIMAILALANDISDLRSRLGQMIVAYDMEGEPVTCDDIGTTGALAAMLLDTLKPTLLQTLEGTPVFVHAGPFANIAHGNSSIIADDLTLRLVGKNGFCVTEAGFGADIGMEKFMNIKCRYSGLTPNCIVIVATVRALKMHGGGPPVTPGAPLAAAYTEENLDLITKGVCNMEKHIENGKKYGVPVVVAINKFYTDTDEELEAVKQAALNAGAFDAIVCNHYVEGGQGAVALAEAVGKACKQSQKFQFLYNLELSVKEKIETIAKEMYDAKDVEYSEQAEQQLQRLEKQGYGKLPICISKTQYSFSGDPNVKGRPEGFTLTVREFRVSAGAGFVYPLIGTINTMPGLPTRPNYYNIDVDTKTGRITGLS